MREIIAYYRVSTREQGDRKNGLDAQGLAVAQYARTHDGIIEAAFQEVESGRKCDRTELRKALARAKSRQALLVVAKLDRLARNVAFTSALMESGVEFVACDNPNANTLTIHILAAIAEAEAKMISTRTKEGLAVVKARGTKLGAHNPKVRAALMEKGGWKKGSDRANAARSRIHQERYSMVMPIVLAFHERGESHGGIADALNGQGFKTMKGRPFTARQVMRIVQRHFSLASSVS